MKKISAGAVVLATTVGLAGAAIAQDPGAFTVSLTPAVPDRGTVVDVTIDGAKLGTVSGGQAPSGARLVTQPGFRFDADAVAKTCTDASACPAASKIGSGTANATVSVFGGSRAVTATLAAYLAPPSGGDAAGVVVDVAVPEFGQRFTVRGRIVRGTGLELRLDDITAGQQLPPGVTFRLERLAVRVGANRTETVTRTRVKRVKRNGRTVKRKVRTRVKVRHDLITTPRTCAGTWTATGTVTFADGRTSAVPISVPCTPARR